jgi:hypothetical protein
MIWVQDLLAFSFTKIEGNFKCCMSFPNLILCVLVSCPTYFFDNSQPIRSPLVLKINSWNDFFFFFFNRMKEKATRKIFSTLEWNDLGITILLRKGIAIAKGIYYIFQKKTTQYFLFSLNSFFFFK